MSNSFFMVINTEGLLLAPVRLISKSSSFRRAPLKLKKLYFKDTKEKDRLILSHITLVNKIKLEGERAEANSSELCLKILHFLKLWPICKLWMNSVLLPEAPVCR